VCLTVTSGATRSLLNGTVLFVTLATLIDYF
jgi:hypothetical protein